MYLIYFNIITFSFILTFFILAFILVLAIQGRKVNERINSIYDHEMTRKIYMGIIEKSIPCLENFLRLNPFKCTHINFSNQNEQHVIATVLQTFNINNLPVYFYNSKKQKIVFVDCLPENIAPSRQFVRFDNSLESTSLEELRSLFSEYNHICVFDQKHKLILFFFENGKLYSFC